MFFVVDSVAYYLFYLYICARMNYYHGKSEDELATNWVGLSFIYYEKYSRCDYKFMILLTIYVKDKRYKT